MPSGNTDAGNRAKASRLRKLERTTGTLDPIDKLWLADYEEKLRRRADEAKQKRDDRKQRHALPEVGASRSKRTVHVDIDEEREAAGTGPTAAAIAAGAALEAREEGRRLDNLTSGALDIMREAVVTYKRICGTLEKHFELQSNALMEALKSQRLNYLANIESEGRVAELEKQLAEKASGVEEMMAAMLQAQLAKAVNAPNGAGK